MRGIDTNVLVRLLVGDDADQAERARAYVTEHAPCWINRIVMCETVWVLERFYGLGRTRIALAFKQVLDTTQFEVEDIDAIQAGLLALDEGADFADAVIAATNRNRGCDATATFDCKASRLGGFETI